MLNSSAICGAGSVSKRQSSSEFDDMTVLGRSTAGFTGVWPTGALSLLSLLPLLLLALLLLLLLYGGGGCWCCWHCYCHCCCGFFLRFCSPHTPLALLQSTLINAHAFAHCVENQAGPRKGALGPQQTSFTGPGLMRHTIDAYDKRGFANITGGRGAGAGWWGLSWEATRARLDIHGSVRPGCGSWPRHLRAASAATLLMECFLCGCVMLLGVATFVANALPPPVL